MLRKIMAEKYINSEVEKELFKPLVFKIFDGLVYFNYNNILMFKADGHTTWLYITYDSPLKPYNCIRILNPHHIERK